MQESGLMDNYGSIFSTYNAVVPVKEEYDYNDFQDYMPLYDYSNNVQTTTPTTVVLKLLKAKEELKSKGLDLSLWHMPTIDSESSISENYDSYSGKKSFDEQFNKYAKLHPEIKQWKNFLYATAARESGFNSTAKNKTAPAWGYFQFMEGRYHNRDYKNVQTYAKTDLDGFLKDPLKLFKAAHNMIKEDLKYITSDDYELAKKKGFDLNTQKGKEFALHAMWLAGPGGFHSWLKSGKNPSDGTMSIDKMFKKYIG